MHSTLLSRAFVRGVIAAAVCVAARSLSAAPVESTISAVTVYADRAVVTRTADLKVAKPGELYAEFEGLPMALLDQSLQFSGRGAARLTVLDVSAKVEHFNVTPNERIKGLEDELLGLSKQRSVLADREGVLKKHEDFLIQIRNATTQPPVQGQNKTTIEEWSRLLTFNDEESSKLAAERQQLGAQDTELRSKEETIRAQLEELRGARGRDAKKVIVRLNAESAGDATVALRYALPGASWTPTYDARLNTAGRELELACFGLVLNGTGEDWKAVALTLSTAKPSLGGSAPEQRPWFVDVARPMPASAPTGAFNVDNRLHLNARSEVKSKSWGANNVNFYSGGAAAASAPEEEAQLSSFMVSSATVENLATSATFVISTPVTLPADNTTQKVPITVVRHKAELQYVATPKLNTTAYLGAGFVNDSDYVLLGGPVRAFLDDTYVASSDLKTVMPGEKLSLSFGADEGLSIKRRQVNRFTEAVGITSKGTRVTYEYLITVVNNKKTAERIRLSEPVPVSRNEKIEVQLLTPAARELGTKESPKEAQRDEEGRLVWRLELKPGEKRELPLKFTIEYPAELNVSGLE